MNIDKVHNVLSEQDKYNLEKNRIYAPFMPEGALPELDKKCECESCKISRELRAIDHELTPRAKKLMEKLWIHMESQITDLEVEILKLKGEWPVIQETVVKKSKIDAHHNVKCRRCNQDMNFIDCYDTGSNGHVIDSNSYAYNLYYCVDCGRLAKQDVWHNAGVVFIDYDNTITVHKVEKIEN